MVTCKENVCASENSRDEIVERNYYIEVKTHTKESRKLNQFRVSREQMKQAILQGDNYILMQVIYDFRLKQGIRCDAFVNPMKCLGEGKLQGEDRYFFWFG